MDTKPLEPETARQVEAWVREDLAQRYTDEFVAEAECSPGISSPPPEIWPSHRPFR